MEDKKPIKKKPVKKSTGKALIKRGIDVPTQLSDTKQMLAGLDSFINRQKTLMEFTKKQLTENVDYGPGWDGDEKKNIYKAGCEKMKNWLQLKIGLFPDMASWKMLGEDSKTVCYTCYLIRMKDVPLLHEIILSFKKLDFDEAEEMSWREIAICWGKGAATVNGTTVKDRNVAVKKARIRSFKDATLELGLSNEFTQDATEYEEGSGEGMPEGERPTAPPKPKVEPPKKEKSINTMMDEALKWLNRANLFPIANVSPRRQMLFLGILPEHNK
ncbi:hypothetical protein ES708_26519 [subsurface metagenome]